MVTSVKGQPPADLAADLTKILAGSPVPSLAAAAVLDGQVVSQGASGLRKVGADEKVSVGDKYHLGSLTKSMTAVLAAMMVDSGKLTWGTTVAEIFPDEEIHPDFAPVTLRQLLTHSGGTPGEIRPDLWKTLWEATGPNQGQRMVLVRGILQEKPAYPPGSQHLYSNAGFAIAGAMIETATGIPFEKLLTEKLFEPLGMTSTGFRAPASAGKVDQPYGHRRVASEIKPREPEPAGDNPRAIAPAGGVHASAGDLAKYLRFHLGGGGQDLLSRRSLALLHTPVEGQPYALGWVVTEREWGGGTVLTHTGTNTMFYAVVWLAPHRDFAALALCNLGGKEGFRVCDETIALLIDKHL